MRIHWYIENVLYRVNSVCHILGRVLYPLIDIENILYRFKTACYVLWRDIVYIDRHRKRFIPCQYSLLCTLTWLIYIDRHRKRFIPCQCCLLCTWSWLVFIDIHRKRFIPGQYCLLCTLTWIVYIDRHNFLKRFMYRVCNTVCYVLWRDMYTLIDIQNVLYRVNTVCYVLWTWLVSIDRHRKRFIPCQILSVMYLDVNCIHW